MIETKTKTYRTFHPSSLGYLQVCPRFQQDDTRDDKASIRGTELHKMVAIGQGDLEKLSEEDRNAVKHCRAYLCTLENDLRSDFTVHKEIAMRAVLSPNADLIGTADVVAIETPSERSAKVVDWKFGFGEVLPADRNPQTMAYAFMVFSRYPMVAQMTTTLVCPMQSDNLVNTHNWDRADLPMISLVLEAIVNRVMDATSQPVLNWAVCRYCGAKATCPQMCQVITRKSETVTPETALELLSHKALSPEIRGKWQQIAEWADDWAKQVKRKNLEAVLTDGEEIDGYGIVRRKGAVKVENTAQAVEKLVSVGYDRNIVMAACALSIPSLTTGLENVPSEQRGGVEKAEIREQIETFLQKFLREGEPVVYLKRSKIKSKKPKELE